MGGGGSWASVVLGRFLCFSLLSLSFFKLPILLSPHSGFPQTSSPKVTSLVAFSIIFSFLKKKKNLIPAISAGPWETGEVNGNSHFSVLKWKPILFQGLSIMKSPKRSLFLPYTFPLSLSLLPQTNCRPTNAGKTKGKQNGSYFHYACSLFH